VTEIHPGLDSSHSITTPSFKAYLIHSLKAST
jgi:hypothetical protein